jgi:RNA polymerase sigma-70 factor (ECF subfamily)
VALEGNFDSVWRTLRSLGVGASSADDASQQVFLVLARRIGDVAPGKERAFLVQTAVRVAANYRRTEHRRREVFGWPVGECASVGSDPECLLQQKQRLEQLEQLLDELPPNLKTVFVLFEVEGMSTPQIAQVLDLPRGTVVSRLRRAREAFTRMVARLGCRAAGGGHQ